MSSEVSVVMPCLNEARTLGSCIRKAARCLEDHGVDGEIIVADNGSTDGSQAIAKRHSCRLVNVETCGYGAALSAGIDVAEGELIIMGDSDGSYDFSAILPFVEKLREGCDLVVGNRYRGGIIDGAMPALHRCFGNPLLTALGRVLFHCPQVGDFYCGLRGFRKAAIQKLELQSTGMEFALEMIAKASMHGLRIAETPTTLRPTGAGRSSHLRTFHDGWRSLRLYLLMSPHWLLSLPGILLFVLGAVASAALVTGPVELGSVTLDYHSLIYSAAALSLGYQAILLGACSRLVAAETGLHPLGARLDMLRRRSTLEALLLIAAIQLVTGLALAGLATQQWAVAEFGDLAPTSTVRIVIVSALFLVLSGQTALAAFYFGTINLLVERRTVIDARADMVRPEFHGDSGAETELGAPAPARGASLSRVRWERIS